MSTNTITAWSYSRLGVYEKCPKQFEFKFIKKIPGEEKNWAADRGTLLHAKAEQVVNGNIIGVPKELRNFAAPLKELKRLCAHTEMDLSVDKAWNTSHTKDWNNVWCRGFADVVVDQEEEVSVIDHKTGKIYDTHEDQGKLYATLAFCHFPNAQVVDVEFWYFDQDDVGTWQYEITQLNSLKAYWNKRAGKMFRAKKFPASIGNHCRWCDYKDMCEEYGS